MKRHTHLDSFTSSLSRGSWSGFGIFSVGLVLAACGGSTDGDPDPDPGLGGQGNMGGDSGDGDSGDGDGNSSTGGKGSGTGGKGSGTGGKGSGTGGKGSGTGGKTDTEGDGGSTSTDEVFCEADQHVSDEKCVACPEGTTAEEGASTLEGDTACSPVFCEEDEHVVNHACVACPAESMNAAGDDASGDDTECESLCETFVNLVPTMSSSEDDFGLAVASGLFSEEYPAWQAFDDTSTLWLSEEKVAPAWLGYEFKGGPKIVHQYSIRYTNGPDLTTRAPKDFDFQGWDGVKWMELDSRSEETGWTSGEERTYDIENPGSFFMYRLYVHEDNDSRADIITVSIGQMKLLGANCSCDPTPVSQIPLMSSASNELGEASASGNYSESYPAWQAFDRTNSLWLSKENEAPAWLAYEFKDGARYITQYSITFANGTLNTRAPKDFSLQGFDGEEWVTLDTRTDEKNWPQSLQTRTYDVANPGSYTKYRLLIEEDNDTRADIIVASIGELQLIGTACTD